MRLINTFVLTAMFWLGVSLLDVAPAQDAAEMEQNLAEVRSRILELEKQINAQNAQRGLAEQQLQSAERSEAEVRNNLRDTKHRLAESRKQLKTLQDQEAKTRAELRKHESEIAEQVRLVYINGQDGWLRAALRQHDPVRIDRELVYYGYIARHRKALMSRVQEKLQLLDETAEAARREQQRQADIQATEQERLAELSKTRESRHLALADINKGIASQSGQIARLQREAEDLESLVAELTRVLANLPIDDAARFVDRKGQMSWPAAGKLIRKFGQARADGRLKWEGVLLSAGAGSEVHAIHHGRVVFSDWLSGMGLLVVIDHGDGYLTLYGHNQDVVREVGEWVTPGTVIAHVGDSGGQATAGLYFEIRKNGQPVNPRQWMAAD